MNDSIFRKKSIDSLKTPETLDQYIRVANFSSWILLFSILILLIGVVVWGCFGKIETKIQTQAFVENGTAFCSVSKEQKETIIPGMIIRINEKEGTIWSVDSNSVTAKINSPDGVYDAFIITETIKPMSLLFDRSN